MVKRKWMESQIHDPCVFTFLSLHSRGSPKVVWNSGESPGTFQGSRDQDFFLTKPRHSLSTLFPVWICYRWESLPCVNGGLRPWIPQEIYILGVSAWKKTAGRKAASAWQFIKGKVHSPGGRLGRFRRWNRPLVVLGLDSNLSLPGKGLAVGAEPATDPPTPGDTPRPLVPAPLPLAPRSSLCSFWTPPGGSQARRGWEGPLRTGENVLFY